MQENIEIEIEKESTFNCPVGSFAATLEKAECKLIKKGDEEIQGVRLVFIVHVPWIKDKIVKAGRNFDPRNRQLDKFMRSWLKDSIQEKIALETLIGKHAEIKTSHSADGNYKHPFVNIDAIYPPGSLKLTAKPEGGAQK
jgi:hypothetical protein